MNASSGPSSLNRRARLHLLGVSLLLAAVTLAIYRPVTRHSFINLDDQLYVTDNPRVQAGLTGGNLAWALTGVCAGNWHPVTMLSHMVDCQLFGLNAGAHHSVNLALHAINTVLLFLVMHLMTGAVGRSAVVAGLFALHPLHVESVAWVSERKDVLSTFFFLLTLLAYARYVAAKHSQPAIRRKLYLLALGFFAIGLMTKPMLVTVPFILLLLDFWPLRRVKCETSLRNRILWFSLLREKAPFFILTAIACVVTFMVQKESGAMSLLAHLPLPERVINALVSYSTYLLKTFWPASLAVYYPYSAATGMGQIIGAVIALMTISVLAVWRLKTNPWLAVGWFWFLGTLVPVIGFVQVGGQALADRYTYIPLIGIFVLVVWTASECVARRSGGRYALAVGAALVLVANGLVTRHQLAYWRDSETLFRHNLAVTRENSFAYFCLGSALEKAGDYQASVEQSLAALRLQPDYAEARLNLGIALAKQGRLVEAVTNLMLVIQQQPSGEAHFNLGKALSELGDTVGAVTNYLSALRLQSNHAEAHNNLGNILYRNNQVRDAAEHFRAAIAAKPDFAEAQFNLGNTFAREGRIADAANCYTAAIRLRPGYTNAHLSLGRAMYEMARPMEAVREFEWVLQVDPNNAEAHFFLATTLSRLQNSREAMTHLAEVIRLRPDSVEAHNNLAWLLATQPDANLRNSARALELATRAVSLTQGTNAGALDTLAAAQATAGKFGEAVATCERALVLASVAGDSNFAAQVDSHSKSYRAGKALFEKSR